MPDTDHPLTTEQWAAARMLVARLRSEAAFEPFDFDDIGVRWLATDDVVCAVNDSGDQMRLGDVFYAAIVMMWSLVVAHAAETDQAPLDVIGQLGIGLALNDPS